MCSSALKIRQQYEVHGEAGTEPVSGPLDEPSANALTLPGLTGIPATLPIVHHKDWWSRLALTMLDAEMLRPSSPYVGFDTATMVCLAFDEWLQSRLTGLRMVGFRIALAATLSAAIGIDEEALDVSVLAAARTREPLTRTGEHYFLSLKPCEWNFLAISKGFRALDAHHAGLGETVWFHVEIWLWSLGLSPVTPNRIEYLTSMDRWYGEEDENMVVEEGGYASRDEYVQNGGLTRAAFDEQMPPCVVKAKKRLSWAALERIANDGSLDPKSRRLVATVVRYHSMFKSWNRTVLTNTGLNDAMQGGAEQINPSVFVRWTDNDLTTEVFDEFAHHYQCGDDMYFEGAEGFDCLPLDEPLALRRWMKQADKFLRAVRMVDQMLTLFEDFNNEFA